MTHPVGRLGSVALDCADPHALAAFWASVLGKTVPNPTSWRVLLDPAGHPFCLTTLLNNRTP